MKLYLITFTYGNYEFYTEPVRIFSKREDAEQFIKDSQLLTDHRRDCPTYTVWEMDLNDFSPPRNEEFNQYQFN